MKPRLLIVALMSLYASSAYCMYSESDPSLGVVRTDSSSVYVVNYIDSTAGKVTLTIKNEQGNLLVTKVIQNKDGFLIPLNFSSVPEGLYIVQINNGTEKTSATIEYNYNTAPTYTQILNLGEDRYLFSSSHAGKETIVITIYDEWGARVFSETRKVRGHFAMVFDLKEVSGEPTFEVTETSGNSLMVPGNPIITNLQETKY